MKKILILFIASSACFLNAQVFTSVTPVQDPDQSFFLEASVYGDPGAYNVKIGKGLVFPRTDLTQFEFITDKGFTAGNYYSCYDGMVVYNTKKGTTGSTPATQGKSVAVTEGFYYFSNPNINSEDDQCTVVNGEWKRIGATDLSDGIDNGKFWTLNGNGSTTPVTLKGDNTEGVNKYTITAGNFLGTTDSQSLTVGTNNIARLNIGALPQEDVGGTDFDFVLKVYGKAKFDDGIVTKASTYPDYVFDNYFTGKSDENPNYEFKKLNEVEAFIKENNHLPGVTKIDDLAKTESGYEIDNTQLSIQTLEKVEELYLHVIEQQKEIQALKAELAELKK